MKGLLFFLFASQTAHAGTVLMPAFFPEEEADKTHANQFHDSLLIELIAAGHTAIGQDALRSRVGRIVDTCAVTSDCPERLFAAWPAPVAVIGEVYSDGEDKGVVVSIYSPDSQSPVRVFDQTVLAGGDWDGVEGILEEVAGLMPEGDTEEGALSLLDSDFEEVRAVQAEGAAEEAQEASRVERLGYIESEDPLGDEEILALLGLGGEDDITPAPSDELAEELEQEEAAVEEVAEDLSEAEPPPVVEAVEGPAAPEQEAVAAEEPAVSEDSPTGEESPAVVEESVAAEGEPSEQVDVIDEPNTEEPAPKENEGEVSRLEEGSAGEQAEEAAESVYDVEVLPELPEVQVADEATDPDVDPEPIRPVRQEAPQVPARADRGDRIERRQLNLDPILYGSLKRSGLDAEDWLAKWRPHVNNAHIEVFGGVPYGDVVRSYDVRLTLDANSLETIGSAQRDTFVEGVGYEFGASFGYTPIPWLDFSALFSVVGGVKELTTAWFTLDGVVVAEENLEEFSPAQSWQAIVEPRVRIYLLPVSPVKLYGLGGITVRFSDGFEAPDLNTVSYPDRPSWTNVGWMVGGGLMFDPTDALGIYVEAPWVHWFSPGDSYSTQSGMIPPKMPGPVSRTGWILRGSAGIQFRL